MGTIILEEVIDNTTRNESCQLEEGLGDQNDHLTPVTREADFVGHRNLKKKYKLIQNFVEEQRVPLQGN